MGQSLVSRTVYLTIFGRILNWYLLSGYE